MTTQLACALATLVPRAQFTTVPPAPARDERLKISRFAYIRFEGALVLASPRGHAHLILHDVAALRVYHALCGGGSIADLIAAFDDLAAIELERFVRLLVACAIVDRMLPGAPGTSEEDADDALRQWEFHDLLLHAESRIGRTAEPVGGTYRFAAALPPPPALKQPRWGGPILELAPPRDDGFTRVPLAAALADRRTLRAQGARPISLAELGGFLHRTARVVSLQSTPWPREYPFGGDYTRRCYPGGGARYELEIYVAAARCDGLDRGLYYYDPLRHQLATVCGATGDFEQLLADAVMAAGGAQTQVLITIASRFQRCSWKYQGLALALQLKNVGVLLAHMYLVATAMALAPCALGTGNSDLFSRLAGLDYLVESSIGEFMLGTRTDEP